MVLVIIPKYVSLSELIASVTSPKGVGGGVVVKGEVSGRTSKRRKRERESKTWVSNYGLDITLHQADL
jgi:hypothetical protein